ncbi:MAG: MFS transporter [Archangium sp.]|nr:MFS transporter [Archangium sp.]
MDVSSELVHALLPVFMVTTLGTSALLLGALEGLAEATPLLVKAFSGSLSDALKNRKWVAVGGYAISAASKPLFVIAQSTGMVAAARLIDRLGKGIRGAPRDALIADLTTKEQRPAAYGLRQSLDSVGAIVGPLLAIALMAAWNDDVRSVFIVSAIPAALAVALLALGVREPDVPPSSKPSSPRVAWQQLDPKFWNIVVIGALFSLARFSEAFLVLRAQERGLALTLVPLVLMVMNVMSAAFAFPFGKLANRVAGKDLLRSSLMVLAAADLLLAIDGHWALTLGGVALWGLQLAMTQGLLSTLVADAVPAEFRATAFGVFGLMTGIATLLASVAAGALWLASPAATFLVGAALSLAALAALRRVPT